MSTIRIEDIAHVRFTAPDLAAMATFLEEFGLEPALSGDGVLYARAAGASPFVHATTQGDPGFAALGLRAESLEDLHALAKVEGVAVEDSHAPGGGKIVRLVDPDGHRVEVVAGQTPSPSRVAERDPPRNSSASKQRLRESVRLQPGPSQVMRLGHAVLEVKDFRQSEAWYKSRFGLLTSDEIEIAPGMAIGAFLRCDRGDALTDHHTLFLLQSPTAPRFNHAAFEVANLDDLMRGHAHLAHARRTPAWGVGRHILGSQIFDYWKDPWGHELEHWTDGDLYTAEDPAGMATLQDLLRAQWGPNHPMMGS
jgi:catechol 2,3-dioxygenase-like lactoylglutathione lyase family enzyme